MADTGIAIFESIKTDGTGDPLIHHVGTNDLSGGYDFSINNKDFKLDGQTINLTANCVNLDAIVAYIKNRIDANSILDVNDYYIGTSEDKYVVIGEAEFELVAGTNDALAVFGWTADTYKYAIIYLNAGKVSMSYSFDYMVTPLIDGVNFDMPLGNRNIDITISNITIYDENLDTTTKYNKLFDLILSHAQKDSDRLYVHVENLNTNKMVYLSYINASDTLSPVLFGRVTDFKPEIVNGVERVQSISFKESWMSLTLS